MPGQAWEATGTLLLVLASPVEGNVRCLVLEDPTGALRPGTPIHVSCASFLSNAELTDQIYEGSTPEERADLERCFGPVTSRRLEPRRVS